MFLRALTIKGFKSFADPATLALEPGVTVVVGPNGSGKSNVVDAVAWVLGAQAPSAVRSSKMDDVIFAGTARRPALGRAEVTLTLDNSSRVLPINLTEVTLRRTLFCVPGRPGALSSPVALATPHRLALGGGLPHRAHPHHRYPNPQLTNDPLPISTKDQEKPADRRDQRAPT